jgi:hypothetical protein
MIDNDIREQLLSTLKSKFQKYDENNYLESYDSSLYVYQNLLCIIKECRKDYLLCIRDILYKIINDLSEHRFKNKNFEGLCRLYNLRLNIIKCRINNESIQTYLHEYIGLIHLLRLGYSPCHIMCQIDGRDGSPDYKTIDNNEWEVKIITGSQLPRPEGRGL